MRDLTKLTVAQRNDWLLSQMTKEEVLNWMRVDYLARDDDERSVMLDCYMEHEGESSEGIMAVLAHRDAQPAPNYAAGGFFNERIYRSIAHTSAFAVLSASDHEVRIFIVKSQKDESWEWERINATGTSDEEAEVA